MVDWKTFADKTKELLESKNLSAAAAELTIGLDKFPNQLNLLVIASDVYRASGDREKSLEYAKLLIKNYPHQPNGYIRSAQDLIELGEKLEAQLIIEEGVKVAPKNLYLLIVSREIFRQSGNRTKCLEYSQNLIMYHPSDWRGYGRAAQDLVALERFEEAKAIVNLGLEKIPDQVNLLTIASDVYRASGDHEISLENAELRITHHPDNWDGYGLAAQELVALGRFEEAKAIINLGLEKIPDQVNLLTIASDVYRASGDHEISLWHAELLITHHPNNWIGYERAAQGLVALKRFKDLENFAKEINSKPIKKDLLLIDDWHHTARAGAKALNDFRNDKIDAVIHGFSGNRRTLIPIGDFCVGAQLLSDSGGRQHALPFDWLFIRPEHIKKIIETDFEDFLDPRYLQSQHPKRQCGHSIYKSKDFFNHHDPSIEPDRSAFARRVERLKKIISEIHSSILFFNVRLYEQSIDLADLIKVLPDKSKIISFVFLGNGNEGKPIIKYPESNILQIIFQCDNQNTYFSKRCSHPSKYTDGRFIYCPYSSNYAAEILSNIFRHNLAIQSLLKT